MNISQFFDGYTPLDHQLPVLGKLDFKNIKVIDISVLLPNQSNVDYDVIEHKRKGKNLSKVYVVRKLDKYYIIDGHHTVIAKKLNGQKKVKTFFLDLNTRKS